MTIEVARMSATSPSTLIEYTRRKIAGFEPVFIDFRSTGREQGRIEVRGNLPGRLVRRHEAGAVFDAGTGRLIALDDPGRMSVARRLDLAMAPLHFGDYGGTVLRWLYASLGVFGALLALTGTLMWVSRHSRQGVHAYRRVVVLVAGGCVVATAALPLLALLAAAGIGPSFSGNMRLTALFSGEVALALPVFLLAWLVSGGLLACFRSAGVSAAVALAMRGLIWLLLPAVAALLRVMHGLPVLDTHPGVSIGLAACGAMLVVSGCRLGRIVRLQPDKAGPGKGRAWPAS